LIETDARLEVTEPTQTFMVCSPQDRVSDTVFGYGAAFVDTLYKKWTKRVRLTMLALACLLPGAALARAAGAASAGSSNAAGKLLKATIASAARQGSFRVTVHFVNGGVSGEVVQDSAGHSGVQTVAIGKERISIVLVGGIAYFSGNSQGLTSYFGLPTSTAPVPVGTLDLHCAQPIGIQIRHFGIDPLGRSA
jgi:hypothetical protein